MEDALDEFEPPVVGRTQPLLTGNELQTRVWVAWEPKDEQSIESVEVLVVIDHRDDETITARDARAIARAVGILRIIANAP